MRAMRVVLAVLVAALMLPGGAALAAPDPIDTTSALPDIEVKGSIAPTKAQRTSARRAGVARGVERVRHAVLARRPRRRARGTVAGRQRRRRRAHLAGAQQGALQAELDRDLALASDSKLAGTDGHAVSLVQTVGGLRASGGGLVTIGVTKAGGGWRIVSATSTINGDETLAGTPQLKAERAWQKAAVNVGLPRALAQVHRARAAKAAPARLEAPEGRRPRPTSSRPARSRSRRSPAATCPRTSRSCSTARAASRRPTACSSTPAAARSSRARAWSTTRPTAS